MPATTPLPTSLSRDELEAMIRAEFPDRDHVDALLALLKPSLFLWPRALAPSDSRLASRLGGYPMAPAGWEWPCLGDEPMLFIGQINCAECAGLQAASPLPRSGWLAFFADPDIATGCDGGFGQEGAVFHWPLGTELAKVEPPEPDVEIMPECGLAFTEALDLPDTFSERVKERFDREKYYRIAEHGGIRAPEGHRGLDTTRLNKLLGWLHPVQGRLDLYQEPGEHWHLLLQVGDYDNGSQRHFWGPGGSLYFVIEEKDLAAGRFDRVQFTAQHT
jgi:uncharacterized protein YwqG